jgi:hypothetical protein
MSRDARTFPVAALRRTMPTTGDPGFWPPTKIPAPDSAWGRLAPVAGDAHGAARLALVAPAPPGARGAASGRKPAKLLAKGTLLSMLFGIELEPDLKG